jgi:subtilisin family serine protease
MSLGTSGSSDGTDTVSQAVNRAADAGIIPVVAAGNSGPGRATIGAPGAAEKAITVAALQAQKVGLAPVSGVERVFIRLISWSGGVRNE